MEELLLAIGQMLDEKLTVEREHTRQLIDPIMTRLDSLEQGQAEMIKEQIIIRGDIGEIKARVLRIELMQENQILPRIGLIAEGHVNLSKRLDQLEELHEKVDDIQNTVSVLKYVFKEHVKG
jgi:hypothetical protein